MEASYLYTYTRTHNRYYFGTYPKYYKKKTFSFFCFKQTVKYK